MTLSLHLGRRSAAAIAAGAAVLTAATGIDAAEAAKLRAQGTATLVSVDGPARLTVEAKGRKLRMHLFGVDAPEAGECGAAESTAALKKLASRDRKPLRYLLIQRRNGTFERDRDGRLVGSLTTKGGYLGFFRGLSSGLIASEWARSGDALGPGDPVIAHGESLVGFDDEPDGPRSARGLWERCGGRVHLPAGEAVPPHVPAPWTMTPSGITTAVGPLALPATLAPGRTLTVANVAAVAPVEMVGFDGELCRVRVPSLEIVLTAAAVRGGAPCSRAEVHEITTDGPGLPTATAGGRPLAARGDQLPALFPRIGVLEGPVCDEEMLALSGPQIRHWAWQTEAEIDGESCSVVGLFTAIGPRDD